MQNISGLVACWIAQQFEKWPFDREIAHHDNADYVEKWLSEAKAASLPSAALPSLPFGIFGLFVLSPSCSMTTSSSTPSATASFFHNGIYGRISSMFPIRSVRYRASFMLGMTRMPATHFFVTKPRAILLIARCEELMLPVSHSTTTRPSGNNLAASILPGFDPLPQLATAASVATSQGYSSAQPSSLSTAMGFVLIGTTPLPSPDFLPLCG